MIMAAAVGCSLLLSSSAQADLAEVCRDSHSPSKCTTAGSSGAAGTASGIFALLKYKQARDFENAHTQVIFNHPLLPQVMDETQISRTVGEVSDGDKVTIVYSLNDEQNRERFIKKMEGKAQGAEQLAESLRKKLFTLNSANDTDLEATLRRKIQAAERAAYEHRGVIQAARMGAAIPVDKLEMVVSDKIGTAQLTQTFLAERLANQSKITFIGILPAADFKVLRGLITRARAGLAGAIVGIGLSAEEAYAGYLSGKLQKMLSKSDSVGNGVESDETVPQFRSYPGSRY
jgi:hypothetical protein